MCVLVSSDTSLPNPLGPNIITPSDKAQNFTAGRDNWRRRLGSKFEFCHLLSE